MGVIVVGVDGSKESKKALRWAEEEARLRDADLRVAYAYAYTLPWRDVAYGESMTREQVARMQEHFQQEATHAREHAEGLVAAVVAEVVGDGVRPETVVVQDRHPAEALVEQAEGADLLVVGSRGRGGFTGLVLGSVSQQCLHHAKCPVVVVR